VFFHRSRTWDPSGVFLKLVVISPLTRDHEIDHCSRFYLHLSSTFLGVCHNASRSSSSTRSLSCSPSPSHWIHKPLQPIFVLPAVYLHSRATLIGKTTLCTAFLGSDLNLSLSIFANVCTLSATAASSISAHLGTRISSRSHPTCAFDRVDNHQPDLLLTRRHHIARLASQLREPRVIVTFPTPPFVKMNITLS
jgi:hypothetical protein